MEFGASRVFRLLGFEISAYDLVERMRGLV
jgi:hypothetical protein